LLLYQPLNGYCYNSDTHFLYHFITQQLQIFKNIQGKVLDIGSGSGILGLLLKRHYEKIELMQCEVQEKFYFLTQKNAQVNALQSTVVHNDFLKVNFEHSFDMCVSNPPFYASSVIKSENQNIKIARYNDSMPLEAFIKKCALLLKPKGKLFFCYDVKQINDIILLLNQYKLNLEAMQFIHPSKQKDASLVMIYARKGSKSLTKINPPLIVFENESFTQEVLDIYKHINTHSIKVEV
jgi:tRNA1(Val) A37 N6-methylase TrmN6